MLAMLSASFAASAPFTQPEPLQLARRRARQLIGELDRARIFVRSDLALDEVLQRLRRLRAEVCAFPKYQHRPAGPAPPLVGRADDGGLGDRGMSKERFFDLWARDVVARADDHVVSPGLITEVAVPVAHIDVPGDVPAVSNVRRLPVASKVAASGRTFHGQASELSILYRPAFWVLDLGHVTWHSSPGAAGADLITGGGDEDVEHLRRADAVDDSDPARVVDRVPRRLRQRLLWRHARAQRAGASRAQDGHHRSVR